MRFEFEAHMMPAIAAASDRLVAGLPDPGRYSVLYEVQAFEAVPDVVIVQYNLAAEHHRLRHGAAPVTDTTSARVLQALTAGVSDIDALAASSAVSRAHLRRSILPTLAEGGWTNPLGSRVTDVELLHVFEPLLNWVVTVEAKRSKWRDAVSQVRRHQTVANRAFMALDATHIAPARTYARDLARDGIGLMSVDAATDTAAIERMPSKRRRHLDLAQQVLGERAWEMRLAQTNVGTTSHVFGRVLPFVASA